MSEAPGRCPACGGERVGGDAGACPACLLGGDGAGVQLGESLELIDELGRGGMGVVHRAYHRRLDREVVVKRLADPALADPEARRRFEREARALARLDHPGIVRVHDFAEHEGQPYLVMELVEGEDLEARVPMAPAEFLPVLRALAEALAYAHAQGLVHRDVKPSNVILADDGRVKLADFGLARLVGPAGRGWTLTQPDRVFGTPHFMAPEVRDGSPPDPRQDVFSLGALAYVVLTGRSPVGTLDPLPAPFEAVARGALAARPEDRFGGMEALLAALDGAPAPPAARVEGSGVGGGAPLGATPSGGAGLDPEHRLALRAAAMVLVVATALVLWALLVSTTPRLVLPGEVHPLTGIGLEPLSDGRLVSRVRFEVWPMLGAAVGLVLALGCVAGLTGWWRSAGVMGGEPDPALEGDGALLGVGVAACGLYALRSALDAAGLAPWTAIIPLLGGALEMAALYLFWLAALEAWRTGQGLARPRLWAGMGLALVPPVHNFWAFLASWAPPAG